MVAVTVSFPCFSPSGEARPVSAPDLWAIARNVRHRLCGGLWPRPLAADVITGRIERLTVNGTRLTPSWDCQHEVHDDDGRPVMGVCEYDPDSPGSVMLSLNAAVVGPRPDLAASTAAHELGHAIFDMPTAVIACRHSGDGAGHRVFRHVTPNEGHFQAKGPKDAVFWSEFRANEFMGGLLAPADLLHRALVIRAGELGLPLEAAPSGPASRAIRCWPVAATWPRCCCTTSARPSASRPVSSPCGCASTA